MKEEITGGLRNALERGETIEKAMQSFINAGYSASEVREAAAMINPSASGLLYGQPSVAPAAPTQAASPRSSASAAPAASAGKPASSQQSTSAVQSSPTTTLPVTFAGMPQPKGRKTAIILAIVLIVLVLVLGITLWFSKDIIAWFSA